MSIESAQMPPSEQKAMWEAGTIVRHNSSAMRHGTKAAHQWPGVGQSSLSRELLNSALPSIGGALWRSPRLAELSGRLERLNVAGTNATIFIAAYGASNTVMFASRCWRTTCDSFSRTVRQPGEPRGAGSESDWLLQLLDVLQQRFSRLRFVAQTIAAGGMLPVTIATCADDQLCAMPTSHGASAEPCHDLVILEYGLLAAEVPDTLKQFEKLLRHLYRRGAAALLLNFPNWCYNPHLTRTDKALVAGQCRTHSMTQASVAAGAGKASGEWHERLAQLAVHYGMGSVSLYPPVRALAIMGEVGIHNLTSEGIHPACAPRSTSHCLYTSYVADLLAHAIEPSSLCADNRSWTGRQYVVITRAWPGNDSASLASSPETPPRCEREVRLAMESKIFHAQQHSQERVPRPLHLGSAELSGVRCYGLVAQRMRSWERFMQSVMQAQGWHIMPGEMVYNVSSAQWENVTTASRKLRGFTSLQSGDELELSIDTTLPDTSATVGDANRTHRHDMPATVQVTYLQSYEQAGVMQLACVQGCVCDVVTVDTLQPHYPHAFMNSSSFRTSQTRNCRLRVRNVSPSASDRHSQRVQECPEERGPCTKIKLVGVAVLQSDALSQR